MSSDVLEEKVLRWLEQNGYPLEMRAAKVLSRLGLWVHQGRRYTDEESGKEREIDLVAFADDDKEKESKLHGRLFIECKWTPKKPLVLFESDQATLTPLGHFMSTPMNSPAAEALERLDSKYVRSLPLFSGIVEGYALVQAFRDAAGTDAGYSATQQIAKAARAWAGNPELPDVPMVYFPTVLIDGVLFAAAADAEGKTTLVRKPRGYMLLETASDLVGVHVVCETHLEEFAADAIRTLQMLRTLLEARK